MSKFLLLATIAALQLGCVITDNDDDDAGDTGTSSPSTTNSTNPTTTSTTSSTSSSSATSSTTATTDQGTEDSSGSAGTDVGTTDATADSGTTGGAACGWGRTGEQTVPMGYICGGDGEDPSGLMPSECPEGIELVEEGDCGGDMGITGVGCCDANGDVWYCADNGGGRALYTQDC